MTYNIYATKKCLEVLFDMNEFGDYLRELRGKLPLREVTRRTGISHTYIRDLELGKKTDPSHEVLVKLAHAYGVSYGNLSSLKFKEIDYPKLIDDYGLPNKNYSIDSDLISFLAGDEITYKGHPLSDDDTEQIKAMLKVLFPDRKWKGTEEDE